MHPELSFPIEFQDKNHHQKLEVGQRISKQQFHDHSMTMALPETSSVTECSYDNNMPPHDDDNSLQYLSSTTTSCLSGDDTQVHPKIIGDLKNYVGFEIDASSQLGDQCYVNIDKEHLSYL